MRIEYPEGATPLDPDEMEGLIFKHVTTRGKLDHLGFKGTEPNGAYLS